MEIQIQFSVIGLFLLFGNYLAYDPATCIQCRDSHMCNPPSCFCCRDKMPLQTHIIPQMVFFTFDDAVNPQVANYYRQLFGPKRLNPNGCPVSMTLFVSHRNTVYSLVKEFYEKGMEIASHSVTHSHMNANTFIREAKKQKENLSKRAGIPSDKIVGWRSPFLEPVGDLQPSVLKDLGYEYDATLTVAKKDLKDKAITPFTLDFGWPYDCKIKPCPTQSHKGFWEVPVVSVKDYLNKYDCVYVDGCNNPPPTENLAYKFLWDNFQKYYTTNRAPMGINMHASWFYYPDRKAAMDRFIKELVKLDDVYIVSVKQVIEWLRNPTPLQSIKTFQPWQCNGNTTSASQTSNAQFDSRSQRQMARDSSFRPQNTRIGNFISNVPKPSFSLRRQTPRPQRRQPFLPTTMPAPVPPMVPSLPMVRFWWRPPNMVDPTIQRNVQLREQQRQETLRRRRLEEERLRRIKAEEQARILEQKRKEELRQQELARQAELLKRQNEMERKRLEEIQLRRKQELEKQRRLEAEQQRIAEEARIKELKRKELVKRHELDRRRQDLVQKQTLSSVENLHQNEFLGASMVNSQQTNAPIVQKPLVQNRNPQNFQNTLGNSQQLRQEVDRYGFTKSPPTTQATMVDQQNSHSSFDKFISMKLDEILEFRPSERTHQLEMLSISELRALQEELRNRLVMDNLSNTSNQIQSKPQQPVNRQAISASTMESQPIQNELQLENKPMLNEFHVPITVSRTKVSEFLANDPLQQEALGDFSAQYIDPIASEPLMHVSETSQSDPSGRFIVPVPSETIQLSATQATPTTQAPPTTTTQTTTTTQKATTTTTTTASPTTQPETSTTTTTPTTTTTLPTTTTTTMPTTTTTKPTTTTTQSTTTTTTPTTTPSTEAPSTEKPRIPVVQRWTALENGNVPWQRWMTERPGMTELQTTTPAAHETKNPSQVQFFTIKDMKKTQPLFNEESLQPLLPSSGNLNKIAIDEVNTNALENNVKEIKHQPKAFVNAPMHFDINYDINGQNQHGIFAGISFNTNRFMSPVKTNFGPVHKPQTDLLAETIQTTQASNKLQESTTALHTTTSAPTTKLMSTATTSATQGTEQPLHTYQDIPHVNIPHVITNEISNIADPNQQPELQQDQSKSNVQFVVQDIVNKYLVTGNESEALLPDITQHNAESVSPPEQLLHVSPTQDVGQLATSSKCIQEVNCMRPDCVCKETSAPSGISLVDTPQIIYITVDGSLNFHTYGKMRSLFSRSRKNPNGCRIKGTVFVTDTGSSYRIADVLQNDGVELAMMGVSSRPYTVPEKLEKDLILQRKRISTSANIPLNEIKGWRSPGFSPVGDEQYDILANQSLYDSSLLLHASAKEQPIPWPHTLDFGWNEACEVGVCPRNKHKGLWEVPAVPFTGTKNSSACEYIDACAVQPASKQETVDYLMDNFNAYYKTNRAPFAIRLKQMWFHWYYRENFAGLLMFLDKVLGFGDVYITSVADTIEWMKSPKPLKDLKQFEKWKC